MEIINILTWIIGTLTGLGVLLAGAGYGYGQFKKGKQDVDDETIQSYERQIQAFQLELDSICKKQTKLEAENRELHAQVNQLIGENKSLRSVKPDVSFQEALQLTLKHLENIATTQKELREEFMDHAKHDDDRFNEIGKLTKETNDILKAVHKSAKEAKCIH